MTSVLELPTKKKKKQKTIHKLLLFAFIYLYKKVNLFANNGLVGNQEGRVIVPADFEAALHFGPS
jgi:hypothetical protein